MWVLSCYPRLSKRDITADAEIDSNECVSYYCSQLSRRDIIADVSRCYCGNTISHESQQVPENVCSRICMGNFQAFCGGSNALTMYEVEPEVTVS